MVSADRAVSSAHALPGLAGQDQDRVVQLLAARLLDELQAERLSARRPRVRVVALRDSAVDEARQIETVPGHAEGNRVPALAGRAKAERTLEREVLPVDDHELPGRVSVGERLFMDGLPREGRPPGAGEAPRGVRSRRPGDDAGGESRDGNDQRSESCDAEHGEPPIESDGSTSTRIPCCSSTTSPSALSAKVEEIRPEAFDHRPVPPSTSHVTLPRRIPSAESTTSPVPSVRRR